MNTPNSKVYECKYFVCISYLSGNWWLCKIKNNFYEISSKKMKTKNDKFRQREMDGGEGKENCFKRALRNKNKIKWNIIRLRKQFLYFIEEWGNLATSKKVKFMKLSWETWGYINISVGEKSRNILLKKFNKAEYLKQRLNKLCSVLKLQDQALLHFRIQ